MPIPCPPSPPRAAIFYDGGHYFVGELATYREVAGPCDTLDEGWCEAKRLGFVVVDYFRTRALFKPRPRPNLPPQGPA